MPSFIDVTCEKCGRKIGWCGEPTDRPTCKCGHRPINEDLLAEAARTEELERELTERLLKDDPE